MRLINDIPGHPAGSVGKVAIANGITWLRYWVRFADGSSVGHIDHASLVRSKDYDTFLASREAEMAAVAHVAEELAHTDEGAGESDAAGATSGGAVVVNGVTLPQNLLDRAKAARARLSS